jgi:hypothetical protein
MIGPGDHLDHFRQLGVLGDAPAMAAVGAGQPGQGRGIARVGLGPEVT